MAQRLAIARSLIHDPATVLLDEPFTGLDAPSADRLAARIEALRAEGRTLVLVTHDAARAAAGADQAIVLSRGTLADWARVREGGRSALHPAVIDVASRMRLSRNGRFAPRKFLDAVARTAAQAYPELADWTAG